MTLPHIEEVAGDDTKADGADRSSDRKPSGVDATRAGRAFGDDALLKRFAPVFDRIAAGAVEREQSRSLPYEPVQWLVEAGYTKLRVPNRFGGDAPTLGHGSVALVNGNACGAVLRDRPIDGSGAAAL